MDTLNRVKSAEWGLVNDGEVSMIGNSLLQPVLSEGLPAMLKVPLNNAGTAGIPAAGLLGWKSGGKGLPARCTCAPDGAGDRGAIVEADGIVR